MCWFSVDDVMGDWVFTFLGYLGFGFVFVVFDLCLLVYVFTLMECWCDYVCMSIWLWRWYLGLIEFWFCLLGLFLDCFGSALGCYGFVYFLWLLILLLFVTGCLLFWVAFVDGLVMMCYFWDFEFDSAVAGLDWFCCINLL